MTSAVPPAPRAPVDQPAPDPTPQRPAAGGSRPSTAGELPREHDAEQQERIAEALARFPERPTARRERRRRSGLLLLSVIGVLVLGVLGLLGMALTVPGLGAGGTAPDPSSTTVDLPGLPDDPLTPAGPVDLPQVPSGTTDQGGLPAGTGSPGSGPAPQDLPALTGELAGGDAVAR